MSAAQFVTMSVACHLLGKHPATLRRWHKAGLLPNTKRTPSNQRMFLLSDLRACLKAGHA